MDTAVAKNKLKILFLSPEAVPFAKTGGLADVAGSLPNALKKLGADVRLMLPFYRCVKEGKFGVRRLNKEITVPFGGRQLACGVLQTKTNSSVPVYLLEREDLFDRPNLYGDSSGDYYDNLERFAFFSRGSIELCESIPFKPDIIHCHDWQTGLVPAILRGVKQLNLFWKDTKIVFTIHNIGYQGTFPADKLTITGLPYPDFFNADGLEFWGQISLLKSGIVYSQAITTVSPKYAQEIQTGEYGLGMEGILQNRKKDLSGILNGVDYSLWNPARDQYISDNYTLKKLTVKAKCKTSLLQEMRLDPDLLDRPLLAMISRLDSQKGLDLLIAILNKLMSLNIGLVILGAGHEMVERKIQSAAKRHTGRLGIHIGFNEPLAHRIMAGADMFLIPSRYEPCGLTQMYALKYGTVPIVRATGGLEDTIVEFDPETGKGNGFKFEAYESKVFLDAIHKAITFYRDTKIWRTIQKNGMKEDFSWKQSAIKYMDLYRSLID